MLTKKVVNDVKSVVHLYLSIGFLILLIFGALPLVLNSEGVSEENIDVKVKRVIGSHLFEEAFASSDIDNNIFSSGFGDGSKENPFVLSKAEDLVMFSNLSNGDNKEEYLNKAYILNKNIDMEGKSWFPVGNSNIAFSGVFDGNGYTISNMKCETSGFCSVFGYLVNDSDSGIVDSGTIENVVIRNCDFSSENVTAGLVAIAFENTSIYNCKVYGGKLLGKKVGGIVGSVQEAAYIQNCCSEENELSTFGSGETMYMGGIVGLNKNGFFSYCYAANNIYNTNSDTVVGGFTGGNRNALGINAYCCFVYDNTVKEGISSSKIDYDLMFENAYGQCYYYCNGDNIDGEDSALKEEFINNVVLTGVNSNDGPFYQGSEYPEIDYTYHMETAADKDIDENEQGNTDNNGGEDNNSDENDDNSNENNENSDENDENHNTNEDSDNKEHNESDNKEDSQGSRRHKTFYDIYTLEKPKNLKWHKDKCLWDKVEFADYYYVSKYRNGNQEGKTKKVYNNEISFKGLKKSGRYKFLVVASSDNKLIADSIPAWSKSKIYKPKVVKVWKAEKTNNSVTLFWNKVDNIQGYRIYMKKDNKYIMHICYLKPETLSKTIGNLDAEHSYYFKVKAVNGGLFSFSKEKKATTVI